MWEKRLMKTLRHWFVRGYILIRYQSYWIKRIFRTSGKGFSGNSVCRSKLWRASKIEYDMTTKVNRNFVFRSFVYLYWCFYDARHIVKYTRIDILCECNTPAQFRTNGNYRVTMIGCCWSLRTFNIILNCFIFFQVLSEVLCLK